jgi:hypothetical protein
MRQGRSPSPSTRDRNKIDGVEDPVEIDRRIEQLIQRVNRRDDYGRLLAAGKVARPIEQVDDADAWRAEIRRNARADRIRVRTGSTGRKLWAVLARPVAEAELADEERYFHLIEDLKSRARRHGHVPKVGARDQMEVLLRCERCEAMGYADAASGPLIGGPLFEEACHGS